jgi:ABC-2 type transport system ATP-binding protein
MARGGVWSVVTSGPAPSTGTVVAALPDGDGTRYRVVAPSPPTDHADAVPPPWKTATSP